MDRRSLLLLLVFGLLACVESPSLGPAPANFTSPITSGGADEIDDQDEQDGQNDESTSVDTSDLPGCDPFADPSDECGAGMDCDPRQQTCGPASGALALGEVCDVEGVGDPCSPGLICTQGRCRQPCDPTADLADPDAPGSCPITDACVLVESDWGVCLAACSLILQDCVTPGEGCNRADGAEGLVAACTRNPGSGGETEPCASDGDCLIGLLCTPQSMHSIECADSAASCCTFVCDLDELLCVGVEPSCTALDIASQPSAGYCGLP
jgi:hypothetical protein